MPVADHIGIHPGVLLLTILMGAETWLLPHQYVAYLLAYKLTEGNAFSHAQGRKLIVAKFIASFIAVLVFRTRQTEQHLKSLRKIRFMHHVFSSSACYRPKMLDTVMAVAGSVPYWRRLGHIRQRRQKRFDPKNPR
jgi:hypothetical protein